jgi:hypothetical protein
MKFLWIQSDKKTSTSNEPICKEEKAEFRIAQIARIARLPLIAIDC